MKQWLCHKCDWGICENCVKVELTCDNLLKGQRVNKGLKCENGHPVCHTTEIPSGYDHDSGVQCSFCQEMIKHKDGYWRCGDDGERCETDWCQDCYDSNSDTTLRCPEGHQVRLTNDYPSAYPRGGITCNNCEKEVDEDDYFWRCTDDGSKCDNDWCMNCKPEMMEYLKHSQ